MTWFHFKQIVERNVMIHFNTWCGCFFYYYYLFAVPRPKCFCCVSVSSPRFCVWCLSAASAQRIRCIYVNRLWTVLQFIFRRATIDRVMAMVSVFIVVSFVFRAPVLGCGLDRGGATAASWQFQTMSFVEIGKMCGVETKPSVMTDIQVAIFSSTLIIPTNYAIISITCS